VGLPAADKIVTCEATLAFVVTAGKQLLGLFDPWSFGTGVAVSVLLLWLFLRRRTVAKSVSVGIPFGLGSATFDLTPRDRVAAWKLHVQLVTRKAALPFDHEHDVIADVLSSLFDLFQVARELLLEMPPSNSSDQHGVAGLIVRVVNDGVRPTLTRWHADYRRWWDASLALPKNAARSPQQIQRDYPRYADLVADLVRMNTELSKFSDQLARVASGVSRRHLAKATIKPQAPGQGKPTFETPRSRDENPPPSASDAVW
jgi:hypothetical protein